MVLNFDKFQKVIQSAQQSDATKAGLKRALKKATNAVEHLQGLLANMETVLSDEYVVVPKQSKVK